MFIGGLASWGWVPPEVLLSSSRAAPSPSGDLIAEVALDYLDSGRLPARRDCSGLIGEVLVEAGLPRYSGSVSELLAAARVDRVLVSVERALALGDLLVFSFTYCKAGMASRLCNPDSHVALVVRRNEDGSWMALHFSSTRRRPVLIRIDPLNPRDPARNDRLAMPGHPPSDRLVRTGELLSSVARLGALAEPEVAPPVPQAVITPAALQGTSLVNSTPAQLQEGGSSKRRARRSRPRMVSRRKSKAGEGGALLRLQVQVMEGMLLSEGQLGGLGCEELWVLRNCIFAVRGYSFETGRAQRYFVQQPWYQPDPAVHEGTAWELLSEVDRRNVRSLQAAERGAGCR